MADNRKLSALPQAGALGAADRMYLVQQGLSCQATLGQFVTFAAATMQPAAANLTALSGLEALAGRVPYFTGAGAMATAPTTAFGRSLLNVADAGAGRALLASASQVALDALSTSTTTALATKADQGVSITGAGLVTGGGTLGANRTLAVTEASEAEALAGVAADRAMTPRRTRAVIDTVVEAAVGAAVDALQAGLDDLAAGQAGGSIAAESWAVLAAYPTGERTAGDYARVIGADAGTHTDPVAGGTVPNRGAYRWSASPAGWRRVGNLESDDAAGFADAAAAAAGAATTQIPKILAALGGDLSSVFSTKEGDENLIDGTFPAGTWGHMHGVPFGAAGILVDLGVNVSASGTGRFITRNPETGIVTWSLDVALSAGVNTFVGGVDFPSSAAVEGDELGFLVTSGSGEIRTGANAVGPQRYFNASAGPDVGDTIVAGALVTWAAPFALSYTLASARDPATDPVEIRARTQAVFERFAGSSTPVGWTLGSAFSVSDGLVSSGTGGWGNYAHHAKASAVAQKELAARVTFSSATSKWALAVKSSGQFYGGALVIDGSTGKLGLYDWFNQGTGTLDEEVSLPTLSVGEAYIARVRVHDLAVVGELLDSSGAVIASVTSSNFISPSGDALAFKGHLAAIHFSGSAKAEWLEESHLYPRRLKLLIVGDSNLAGTVSSAIGETWGMRLARHRTQKDIMISAVGGDTAQWLNRLDLDLNLFEPERVLLAIGSNYSSLSSWRADIRAMIAVIAAAGAEPVIASQLPRASTQALMDSMNADIFGRYFGDVRILDIAAAVTAGGDRQTWTAPAQQVGDNIHLSRLGHIAAFEYVRDECPWLWRDLPTGPLS